MGDAGQPTCLMHKDRGISKARAGAVSTAHRRRSQTSKGAKFSKAAPLPVGQGKGEVPWFGDDGYEL